MNWLSSPSKDDGTNVSSIMDFRFHHSTSLLSLTPDDFGAFEKIQAKLNSGDSRHESEEASEERGDR